MAGVAGETRTYKNCAFSAVPIQPNGGTIILDRCTVAVTSTVNGGLWTRGAGTIILLNGSTVPASAADAATTVDASQNGAAAYAPVTANQYGTGKPTRDLPTLNDFVAYTFGGTYTPPASTAPTMSTFSATPQ